MRLMLVDYVPTPRSLHFFPSLSAPLAHMYLVGDFASNLKIPGIKTPGKTLLDYVHHAFNNRSNHIIRCRYE